SLVRAGVQQRDARRDDEVGPVLLDVGDHRLGVRRLRQPLVDEDLAELPGEVAPVLGRDGPAHPVLLDLVDDPAHGRSSSTTPASRAMTSNSTWLVSGSSQDVPKMMGRPLGSETVEWTTSSGEPWGTCSSSASEGVAASAPTTNRRRASVTADRAMGRR